MNEKSPNFHFLFISSIVLMIFIYGPLSIFAQASDPNINNLSNSNTSQINMPPGGDIVGEFYGAHHGTNNNTTITDFINTYGIKTWNDKVAYDTDYRYEYVYVVPEKNYSKKLVFLYYRPDLTGLNNSILWVKLIDQNETLSPLDETPGNDTPGFTVDIAIVSIIISLLVSRHLKMK